jgi:hypothetical protein
MLLSFAYLALSAVAVVGQRPARSSPPELASTITTVAHSDRVDETASVRAIIGHTDRAI